MKRTSDVKVGLFVFTGLVLTALVIFLIAFAAVMVRLFARSRREELDAAARIPLEDGVVTPRVGATVVDEREAGR